jgi:predicted enzyme related to lactoylglutathione lyase
MPPSGARNNLKLAATRFCYRLNSFNKELVFRMRIYTKPGAIVFLCLVVGWAALVNIAPTARSQEPSQDVAVGPQYDSTHVYVPAEDFNRFVASILATFGGRASKESVATVTPTPSSTISQVVFTPVGFFSIFGFKTPIPYPFGAERTGYLVTDMDAAIRKARAAGADVIVAPFDDPIGKDAIIQFPGGINTQLYWHTKAPSDAALQTIPENRVYLSADAVAAFTRSFVTFSQGKVVSDESRAPGIEIGRPIETYRRVRIHSKFGALTVLVTDGHLPYPYGREVSGYDVANLEDTLQKAKAAGVTILVPPYESDGRIAAMLKFPGGFIAEVHTSK